ncbi:hypothetical protein EVAR_13397_1 [Eumeta japonica]|uniref:Uncharacterized protein n=1 Tax=Eumeta variegata TaxID=151549 RepID=A0A4C1V6J9_EUMVA|nr:hypothetical protein EVAR_13397_1 [Eumeta japonica]
MGGRGRLGGDCIIRATIYRDVRTMSIETCHFLGLDITKSAIEVVAELLNKKLRLYGKDLEAFANVSRQAYLAIRNGVLVTVLVCGSETWCGVVEESESRISAIEKSHITNIASTYPAKERKRKTIAQTTTVCQSTISDNDDRKCDTKDDEAMAVDDVVDLTID